MEYKVYKILKEIRDKYGHHEFGKISQKLLGIALCRLGFDVKERSVQDVDIEAVKNGTKYWLEVKTTDKDTIQIQKKDVECLDICKMLHGGITTFAVLKLSLLSDWVITSSDYIKAGTVRVGSLAVNKINSLTDDVNRIFPSIIEDYKDPILNAGRGRAQWVADRLLKEEIRKKNEE